jgi:ketosteroid isomerase-like protein
MSSVDFESEKKELERLTQAYVKAENDKQVEEMTKFYAPDIISHFPFMPEVRGIEANRKQSEEYMTETGFFTYQTTKIDVSEHCEMAYLAGTYHYTISDWTADSFYPESSARAQRGGRGSRGVSDVCYRTAYYNQYSDKTNENVKRFWSRNIRARACRSYV